MYVSGFSSKDHPNTRDLHFRFHATDFVSVEERCLASELQQKVSFMTSLELSDHKEKCRGYISPLFGRPLTVSRSLTLNP